MTDAVEEVRNSLRRSIVQEFVDMEDVFDDTKSKRNLVVSKLMEAVDKVSITDDEGILKEDASDAIKLYATTLKALSDAEKSSATAISLKLKQAELQQQSSQAAKDRIAIVLRATAPGQIIDAIPHEQLAMELSNMFDKDIKDFELKANSRDLTIDE